MTRKKEMRSHVMMLSSLGHGHLIPFMQLAQKMAAEGLTLSFVTTFHHIPSLRKKVEDAREAGLEIHLLEMEIPRDHMNINSAQWNQMPPMLSANERLQPHFDHFLGRFLAGEISFLPSPVCLIADFLLGWSSAVAQKFGIPRVCFETSGMYAESVHQVIWDTLPRNLPRTESGQYLVPGMPREVRLSRLQILPELPEATTENGTYQFWLKNRAGNKQSWRTIVNTFDELEGEFVHHFERVNGTLRTIGPLLQPEAFQDGECKRIALTVDMGVREDGDKCMQWLDAQAESSVLYISFGSQNSISIVQMEELALGLESSGVKFLWVLRTPSDALQNSFESVLDFLPAGLQGRMVGNDQGLFVLGWAPQLGILKHAAIGGFLSHCGWNAVLESTTMGIPLIAWPLRAEQHFNSKFVVDEIGIALEAPQRIEQNWLVTRDDVERIVRLLMIEDKGKELRKRVKELAAAAKTAVAEGGSSSQNFDLFVSEIMALPEATDMKGKTVKSIIHQVGQPIGICNECDSSNLI
ncbi:anthocyanidin 3-O-glucosyltransferase 2 [Cryptomeria japonica]|uniref:anthocyanidin 3-O-glucosyltransferase 2 n=1 Tax=Cryptomeria japonica TaxID=3369 RepID=UPI0027DA8D2D|nr:anthocyanidin 3-O-glucosyltransferase 2 [Cryptomeria japonica]